jgi:cellulose synthase/poly-beta-1,6-N-acetylglucosamine synthase-like glycosyltransferase
VTSLFLEFVAGWEVAAIVVTLIISSYLILNLVAAVLRPPPERRYRKDSTLPVVSVVIPVYNEPPDLVRASIASWKQVRYPAFEIVVADDSTEPLELNDPSVRVIRRTNRDGFKGGALREVVARLDPASEWMVIFDADFVVDPDVLVRFTEHFRPGVGGVQGFQAMGRNERPTYLTRYSEAFHAVANALLAGRYRLRGFVGVQGTVEAYRVEAIRAIGGIAPYATANEDLDTTFRLRKAGWKIVYDPRIVGRGIAPDRYGVFFRQSTRWTSTTVREYRRHLVSFLRSPNVPAVEKVDSVFFLLTWVNSLVVTPTLLFLPWALLDLHVIPLWLSILITALPLALFTLPVVLGTRARLAFTGWLGYYVLLLPGYLVMFRASLLGLFTDPGFLRTSKVPSDSAARSASRKSASLSARPEPPVFHPGAPTMQGVFCAKCGRALSHREVLFYAVGGLDVGDLSCRHCLGHSEWHRFRSPTSA